MSPGSARSVSSEEEDICRHLQASQSTLCSEYADSQVSEVGMENMSLEEVPGPLLIFPGELNPLRMLLFSPCPVNR